jgi:hypothetical protein
MHADVKRELVALTGNIGSILTHTICVIIFSMGAPFWMLLFMAIIADPLGIFIIYLIFG